MSYPRDRPQLPAVAMVTRRVHPAHGPGGLERHVYELVVHLARQGVEIDLFAAAPSTLLRRTSAERAFPSGVRLHWVADRWLPLGDRRGTVVVDRITNYPLWSYRVARQIMAHHEPSGRFAGSACQVLPKVPTAVCSRLFTVPSGISSISAICL